jgi:hypothetical protein
MSTNITTFSSAPVERRTDEDFLAVICADELLLRAEFEAIIAASWPGPVARREPPPRRPAGPPPGAKHHRGRQTTGRPRRPRTGRSSQPNADGPARQRSPPGPPRRTLTS